MTPLLAAHADAQKQAALVLAIDAGALRVCTLHGRGVFTGTEAQRERVQQRASQQFRAGRMHRYFGSLQELHHAIATVLADRALTQCPLCRQTHAR